MSLIQNQFKSIIFTTLLFLVSCPQISFAKKKRSRSAFVHQTPATAPIGKAVKLSGQISKSDSLDYAELRFRKMGNSNAPFRAIKLRQKNKNFFVIIPKRYIKPPGIEYYVVGVSFEGKTTILSGSPAFPKQFLVVRGVEEVPGEERSKPKEREGDSEEKPNDEWDSIGPKKKKKGSTQKRSGSGEKLRTRRLVQSATKHTQSQIDAPITTTVITAQDIQNQGWRTLTEILRFVPGLDINFDGLWPDIGMRGVNASKSRGNRILFLIDGHDMSFRQMQQNLLSPSWISVDDIDRIEILRGSSSGIWGSGSYNGTIHIITKSGRSMNGASFRAGISPITGSNFLTIRGGASFASGFRFYASFSKHQDIRSPVLSPVFALLFNPKDAPSNLYYTPVGDRSVGQNFRARLSWKGLFLNIHNGSYAANAPMNQYSVIGGDDSRFITNRTILRLGWRGKVNKKVSLYTWLSYDYMHFTPDTRVEFNPLLRKSSRDTEGRKYRSYQLQKRVKDKAGKEKIESAGSLPICENLADDAGPCIATKEVSYTEKGKPVKEKACVIYQKAKTSAQPAKGITSANRYTNWFPITDCRPGYLGKRHLRQLVASDKRFQAGLQLTFKISKSLVLTTGFDLEYLQSSLWHFPMTWLDKHKDVDTESSHAAYTNFRGGLFLQGQFKLKKLLAITVAARIDYDQIYGVRLSPNAGVVLKPFPSFFAKLHYGWGFRSPSLYEFYHAERDSYGNPLLAPEQVHNIGLQAGWKNKILYAAVSGFLALHSNNIIYEERKGTSLPPLQNFEEAPYKPIQPKSPYQQLINQEEGMMSLGLEVEGIVNPTKGLELKAHLGLAFAPTDPSKELPRQPYASGINGGLSASYRYKLLLGSVGVLFVGSKLVPSIAYKGQGSLPSQHLPESQQTMPVPSWQLDKDNRLSTGSYVKLRLTLQLIEIFKHVDLGFRGNFTLVGNIQEIPAASYDAGDPFLHPHKKFEVFTWIRAQY